MGLKISTSRAALMAQRDIKVATQNESKELQKLSSGKRIVSAGDDPVGSAQVAKLEAQIRSVGAANRSAKDALSFVQVAEGGLSSVSELLIRLKEITIQGSSEAITQNERDLVVFEYNELISEIDRLAETTEYGDARLLAGKESSDLFFQVGISSEAYDKVAIDQGHFDSTSDHLGLDQTTSADSDYYADALADVDNAIEEVNSQRAELGAFQARFNAVGESNSLYELNLENAKSEILDTDIATAASKLVSAKLKTSAAISVLAQANSLTEHSIQRLF